MILSDDHKFENKSQEYYWLGLSDEEFLKIINSGFNPLENRSELELKTPGLREIFLMNQPEYFYLLGRLILNLELYPLQCAVLRELWNHPFSILIASRGFSKTFSIAVLCLMRMVLQPEVKLVGIGAAFRQSKLIMQYMVQIWNRAPVLRGLYKGEHDGPRIHTDRATFRLGTAVSTFLPIGNGDRIRGERANGIYCDEFSSIDVEIFQTVVENFAAVSSDPISNMKKSAFESYLRESGQWDDSLADTFAIKRNHSVISGTMAGIHENLNLYLEKYSNIIKSKGDQQYLKDVFGENENHGLNHKDFCVIRIPYDMIPKGFMDDATVQKFKMTSDPSIVGAEYYCVPISDTHGFYKKSLIDGCTASHYNTQQEYWPEWCPEEFNGTVRGNPKYSYVYGIDPAHSSDNFAIVILEIRENHSRVVYCWTTNKKVFAKQRQTIDEDNYYAYCAKKIRSLMLKFPTDNIVMDTQGGGIAVCEALHDKDKIAEDEVPLWPVVDPDKAKDTDLKSGRHILHMIDMSQSWNASANHALHKDLQDKILLFPVFNSVIAATCIEGINSSVDYDRQDDCMLEIEDLKKELVTIVKQQTPTGKERWDTPDRFSSLKLKNSGQTLRKDRFSALLLANSVARGIKIRTLNVHNVDGANYSVGRVGQIVKTSNQLYIGNRPDISMAPSHLFRGINR